jgi:alpha-L-rhamnosidase
MRYLLLSLLVVISFLSKAGLLEPYDLSCDLMVSPLGVDSDQPKLSWKLRSMERGQRQTAWRVIVASDPGRLAANEGNLWDSSRQAGDDQLDICYGGRQLKSSEQVFWKVKVWDRSGQE